MAAASTPLADAFPPATREAWTALVEAGLKGAPFSRLVTRTADGLDLQPLYTAEDAPEGRSLFAPGEVERPWQVRTVVDAADAAEANGQALQDLQGGAASVLLRYAGPGRRGLGKDASLPEALKGVLTDLAPIALDAGFDGPQAAEALSLACGRGPAAPLALHLDPLSAFAVSGPGPRSLEQHVAEAAATATRLAELHPAASLFLASGVAVHEAGGTEAQELGFAAAAALAYARTAEAAGLDAGEALARTVLGLAVDGRYFLSLAKLRAMHAIWARLTAVAGRPLSARIEARGSKRMLSAVDPWVNLIRGTAAVFAAATGGAEAVVLQPFTEPLGAPTDFARRQARNIQLVLMEEAHLGRVADPAAGSWYLESFTDRLARAGWAVMQEIERRGGAAAVLEDGWLAGEVAKARAALEKDVATRKTGLIGVSEFPNLAEAPVEVAAPGPSPGKAEERGRAPLPPMRLSEPFERLRAGAQHPRAFLAQLGSPVEAAARTGFARNLLAAGGIAAEAGEVEAYDGAPLAVICGSDERYVEEAEGALRALKAKGARAVWLAGKPGEHDAGWREAGMDGFLFAGMDAVAALQALTDGAAR